MKLRTKGKLSGKRFSLFEKSSKLKKRACSGEFVKVELEIGECDYHFVL